MMSMLKRLVADLIAAPGKDLAEVVLREASSVSDESRSLVHWFTKSKIGPEWAGRVRADGLNVFQSELPAPGLAEHARFSWFPDIDAAGPSLTST
jgi:hypothetical protein